MFACTTLSLGGEDPNSVQRKRLQRVEILKIAEPCPLIDPSQVVVTQGEILVADPVLTPIGKNPSYISLFWVRILHVFIVLHDFTSN